MSSSIDAGRVTRSRSRQQQQQQQQGAERQEGVKEQHEAAAGMEKMPSSPIAAEEDSAVDAGTGFPSPDAAADAAGAAGAGAGTKALRKARRKLSIMSDNALVDGIADIELDDALTQNAEKGTGVACVVNSYAGASRKGYAPYNIGKKNQDAIIMAEEPHTCSLLFCVLDGHGVVGELVSSFFQRELARALFAHDAFVHSPATAFTEVLALLEARLLRDPHVDTDFSGTTLSAALLRGDRMWTFNVGDSRVTAGVSSLSAVSMEGDGANPSPGRRARLLRRNVGNDDHVVVKEEGLRALPITVDHKPELEEEKARILAAGGRVFAVQYDDGVDGPPRVWLGHVDIPGLAMSRSLGDAVAHSVGVSSVPEVVERRIDPKSEHFLIIATDGLWEFVSDQDAVHIASQAPDPQQAVDALIREANRRWLAEEEVIDDTSVCVAFLGAWRSEGLTAPASPYSPVRRST